MKPFPVLLLLFVLVPVVEIYFLIQVGGLIGALPTVLLVILTAVAGASLVRYQGLSTMGRLQATLARGEVPAVEMLEGMILLVGAVLLLTPGFVTDAVGFACLIPALRHALALRALKHFMVAPGPGPFGTPPARGPRTLEGEFHRDED